MKTDSIKTGIILDISNGTATVLKNGGEFVTMRAKRGWKKGDLISIENHSRHSIFYLVACFALFFALGAGGFRLYFTQDALISIDINPSIELSLNRFDRILSATARNEEGELVLTSIDFKGQSYRTVIEELLKEYNMESYLKRNGDLVVAVFSENKNRQIHLLQNLQTVTQNTLSAEGFLAVAEFLPVDEQIVNEAHTCGVSAGKYYYLNKLKEISPDIDLSDYGHHSISQIKGQIRACEKAHANPEENINHGFHHGHHH